MSKKILTLNSKENSSEEEKILEEEKVLFEEETAKENNEEIKSNEEIKLEEKTSDEEAENDSIIEKDYLKALLNQKKEGKLIYFEVNNIYSNEKTRTYKSKLKLKKEPPILTIRDEEENEVEFQLTENFTDELLKTLEEVKRAYYGFDSPVDINAPEKGFEKFKYYFKKNIFKIAVLSLIVIYFLILNFS